MYEFVTYAANVTFLDGKQNLVPMFDGDLNNCSIYFTRLKVWLSLAYNILHVNMTLNLRNIKVPMHG